MPKVSKEVRAALKAAKQQYGEVWANYMVEQNREATLRAQEEIENLGIKCRETMARIDDLRAENNRR